MRSCYKASTFILYLGTKNRNQQAVWQPPPLLSSSVCMQTIHRCLSLSEQAFEVSFTCHTYTNTVIYQLFMSAVKRIITAYYKKESPSSSKTKCSKNWQNLHHHIRRKTSRKFSKIVLLIMKFLASCNHINSMSFYKPVYIAKNRSYCILYLHH